MQVEDLGEPPVLSFQSRRHASACRAWRLGWKLSTAASDTERERVFHLHGQRIPISTI